jgi:hypothetical protein
MSTDMPPAVGEGDSLTFLQVTGSLFGSLAGLREQVAEPRDAGVRHHERRSVAMIGLLSGRY